MTAIKNHLYRNDVKKSVVNEECNNIIRAGNDIMQQCYIINSGEEQPKVISKEIQKQTQTSSFKINPKIICGYVPEHLKKIRELITAVLNHQQKSESWHHIFKGMYQLSNSKKFRQSFWWIKEQRMPKKSNRVTINVLYVRQKWKM